MILMLGWALTACGGGSTAEQETISSELSTQQRAELIAAALSAEQGGVEDDIAAVTQAAAGEVQQQAQARNASLGLTISVNVDFYDALGELQLTYDADTTERIGYQSLIKGNITNGTGYFSALSIENRSDFSVEDILSRFAWINGTHSNHSSYERTQVLTNSDVRYQLDSELTLTDVAVDLDASDTFPESGTIEGSIIGSYERVTATGAHTHNFNFHFIATYLGDNSAEIELGDGTVFIVQLDSGSVTYTE
jgi:hypothetical protein